MCRLGGGGVEARIHVDKDPPTRHCRLTPLTCQRSGGGGSDSLTSATDSNCTDGRAQKMGGFGGGGKERQHLSVQTATTAQSDENGKARPLRSADHERPSFTSGAGKVQEGEKDSEERESWRESKRFIIAPGRPFQRGADAPSAKCLRSTCPSSHIWTRETRSESDNCAKLRLDVLEKKYIVPS